MSNPTDIKIMTMMQLYQISMKMEHLMKNSTF